MSCHTDLLPVKKTINCKGRLIDLSGGKIMGVLNVTPDSFFDGGQYTGMDTQISQVGKMLKEGAGFIDIGGFSTRPGADDVSEEEELKRVIHSIERISLKFP